MYIQQYTAKSLIAPKVAVHPLLPDALVILNYGPRDDLHVEDNTVVVDVHCGTAVMRGADVFVPGVLSVPRGMTAIKFSVPCKAQHKIDQSPWLIYKN